MQLQAGPYTYTWQENWAQIPSSTGFAHHGMAASSDGTIFVGDISEPRVHVLTPEGELLRSFDLPVAEIHGICMGTRNGQPTLWITDTGSKPAPARSGISSVLQCTTQGEIIRTITPDDLGYQQGEPCALTACAQDPESDCLWITDGYGSNRVHCIDPDGKPILCFDGSETQAGKHKTPHWIWVDRRKGSSEIYVADRSNNRILVYATDGQLLRCLDKGFNKPSGFAAFGDILVVAELAAGIVLLDKDDQIIAPIGVNREALERPGWPNCMNAEGQRVAPSQHLEPGLFNSPHGIAADPQGNIYISEWLYGGRYIRLKRS